MSILFPELTTPFTRPLADLEPRVVWLQRSTEPEAVTARRHVNAWYGEFPDPAGRLAAKLTSANDGNHYSALDELYIHHALRQVERDVRYEEGGRGPDFRVYRDGRQVLAVEVLSLFMREEWTREARRHHELTDRLNKTLRPQGYFLHVEVLVQPQGSSLPLKDLTEFAEAFLKVLPDPQVATAAYEAGRGLPWRDFDRKGIHVRFEALPMRPNAASLTNPDARIVRLGPVIGGLVDSQQRLKNRLEGKRKLGYVLDPAIPFVLVVGNRDSFCGDLQLLLALYGRDWEALVGRRPPLWQRELRFRGFLGLGMGETPYNSRFSAVAVINGWVPWTDPASIQWLIFDNPHARVPLPNGLLPITHRFELLNGGTWGWRPARSLP